MLDGTGRARSTLIYLQKKKKPSTIQESQQRIVQDGGQTHQIRSRDDRSDRDGAGRCGNGETGFAPAVEECANPKNADVSESHGTHHDPTGRKDEPRDDGTRMRRENR